MFQGSDKRTEDGPQRPGKPDRTDHDCPRVASDILFGNTDVVLIEHGGETYQLRRTRAGKLILTK
jgi:hemin uptake protein HemP